MRPDSAEWCVLWPYTLVLRKTHFTRGQYHWIEQWIVEQTGDTQFFNHVYSQEINGDTHLWFKNLTLAVAFRLRWDRGH